MTASLAQSFILSVFMGGLIGWVTNWLAIRALFYPREPFKLLFFEFQGLLPKRQRELAQNLGKIVEGELLSVEELIKRVEPADVDPIIEDIMRKNRVDIEQRIKEFISSVSNRIPFFNLKADTLVKSVMDRIESELCVVMKKQVPLMLDRAAEKAAEKISVQEIVIEKVCRMDLAKLENIFNRIAEREMTMIIRFGGILGVLVGCCQWAIQNFIIN
ncbi:MAG: DUF445 family protein [Erysipelotrichia bacterium]|nr:DUF445 family protein [Erysipelotrichia bacterium]